MDIAVRKYTPFLVRMLPLSKLSLKIKKVDVLIDSGSSVNIIDEHLFVIDLVRLSSMWKSDGMPET
jgi:hypothetical protein